MAELFTSLAHFLRGIIIGGSVVAVVASLYLATRNARARAWSYVCARVGFALVVGLVAEAVWRSPFIPSSWRVWLYIVGLFLTAFGYIGIARRERGG